MERSRPIPSEIKSKRIKWCEPQAPLSWAYMKELREHHKTKKVHPIDPYVEVYQFRDNLYGLYTENADGMSDPWMYLILGPMKALLIDTGYGIGDLQGLVEELAGGKPVIVANTHGGCDHSFGNCRFDKIYCHKYEVPRLEMQNARMWDYLFDKNGRNIWLDFDKADLPQFKKYEIVSCEDGHIFDLGEGYEIEMIWTGGHTPGHVMYLDKTNRILFPGDCLVSMRTGMAGLNTSLKPQPYGEYACLRAFREPLRRVVDRMSEYDFVFPQHLIVEVECDVMADELNAVDALLESPDNADLVKVIPSAQGKSRRYRLKYIKGFGPIGYPEAVED